MTAARRPYVHVRARSPILLAPAHRRLVVAVALLELLALLARLAA